MSTNVLACVTLRREGRRRQRYVILERPLWEKEWEMEINYYCVEFYILTFVHLPNLHVPQPADIFSHPMLRVLVNYSQLHFGINIFPAAADLESVMGMEMGSQFVGEPIYFCPYFGCWLFWWNGCGWVAFVTIICSSCWHGGWWAKNEWKTRARKKTKLVF